MRTVLALSLLAAACGSGMSNQDRLLEAVHRFNDDVRWGRWDSASTWLAPATRREFFRDLAVRTHRGDLQTADVEVVGFQPLAGDRAIVRVERAWYLISESELHEGLFEQSWALLEGEWRMLAERPIRAN